MPDQAAATPPLKIAVITPFHKTPAGIFRQCCDSVANQTYPCTHLVVADGPPLPDFVPGPGRLLAVLPQANADYGNTPRAIGGILAESYGLTASRWSMTITGWSLTTSNPCLPPRRPATRPSSPASASSATSTAPSCR